MFDFFGKKKEEVKLPTTAQPVEVSTETGKEVQLKDARTGELVFQRPMPEAEKKVLFEAMQKNARLANDFIVVNRQRLSIEERIVQVNKEIVASEVELNTVVTKIRDTLKIDKRWAPNYQTGVMERRDPPQG